MQLVLVGAGGHARVVLEAARAQGLNVVAAIDERSELHGTAIDGIPIVGGEAALDGLRDRGIVGAILGVGSVDVSDQRQVLFKRLVDRGFELPAVRHPTSVISPTATVGEASVVFAGAIISAHARLGLNVIVNTSAIIEHDCAIGDHVHISPGALLAGGVQVGHGSHIGIGAILLQGVHIGAGVMVGAGSVVLHDVGDAERVAGVPARSLRSHGSGSGPG